VKRELLPGEDRATSLVRLVNQELDDDNGEPQAAVTDALISWAHLWRYKAPSNEPPAGVPGDDRPVLSDDSVFVLITGTGVVVAVALTSDEIWVIKRRLLRIFGMPDAVAMGLRIEERRLSTGVI
jgi:hypothetical protein